MHYSHLLNLFYFLFPMRSQTYKNIVSKAPNVILTSEKASFAVSGAPIIQVLRASQKPCMLIVPSRDRTEDDVGFWEERGAYLLKCMYCSARFLNTHTGTLSYQQLQCSLLEEKKTTGAELFHYVVSLTFHRHAKHKPENLAHWVLVPADHVKTIVRAFSVLKL